MGRDILVAVVSTDRALLNRARSALGETGYDVVSAGAVSEAITVLAQEVRRCCALVTDVDLGDAVYTGWDLARDARELMPHLAVIYCTWTPGAEWTAYGVRDSVLLAKPSHLDDVVAALSRLLGRAAPVR